MRRALPLFLVALVGLGLLACSSGDTATAEACPSPEQQAYLDTISTQAARLGDAYGVIQEHFQSAASNTNLLIDDTWRTEVAGALVITQAAADELAGLEEVDGLEEVHAILVPMSTDIGRMVDLTIEGLDEFSAEKLTNASALMVSTNEQSRALTEEARALCQ